MREALDKAYVRPLDPKDATTEAVNKKFQSNVEAFAVLAKKINLQPQ